MADEIGEKVRKAYRDARQLEVVEDGEYANDLEVVLANALRDTLARALKAEAWLAWITNGKQGPSPSMFIDDYKVEAGKQLKGDK